MLCYVNKKNNNKNHNRFINPTLAKQTNLSRIQHRTIEALWHFWSTVMLSWYLNITLSVVVYDSYLTSQHYRRCVLVHVSFLCKYHTNHIHEPTRLVCNQVIKKYINIKHCSERKYQHYTINKELVVVLNKIERVIMWEFSEDIRTRVSDT